MTSRNVEEPQLPATVFGGSYLLSGVAAVASAVAVATFYAIPEFIYIASRPAHDSDVTTLSELGLVAYGLLAITFGGICLLLAALDRHGNNLGRVLTWVLGGLTICFNITVLVTGVFDSVSWYGDLTWIAAFAIMLFMTGAVTFLAVPASHKYFRSARATREQKRPLPGPPAGYRPPNELAPPPGYQPPSFRQQTALFRTATPPINGSRDRD